VVFLKINYLLQSNRKEKFIKLLLKF